jgi:CBS domain-containing protein
MRRLQKTIEDVGWTKNVPTFAKTDTVSRAFDAMSHEAHDCVLILDGSNPPRLSGIFTSRDFLNRVAAERRDPGKVMLGDVMTSLPKSLRPRDGLAFAINWMAIEGFRNVPIIDDDGNVLGVLTVWDVMHALEDVFLEIDATPRPAQPTSDISEVISMVDLGGGG